MNAWLRNPPACEEYDLIGLHFSPTVLSRYLSEDDWIVGMVRHPTERLLSAVVHSRRDSEDPETFTPSMRARREMDLVNYLLTDYGRNEARLQLTTFAPHYREPAKALSDEALLSSALAFARSENVVLAPSERSQAFSELLAKRLSFRPQALGRLNANEAAMRTPHLSELNRAIEAITGMNVPEREFYEFVCHSFGELYRELCPPRRVSHQRHWYASLIDYARAGNRLGAA